MNMGDFKRAVWDVLKGSERGLLTRDVVITVMGRCNVPQKPEVASNILTDISSLTVWGFVQREGRAEQEHLLLTDKGRRVQAEVFEIA